MHTGGHIAGLRPLVLRLTCGHGTACTVFGLRRLEDCGINEAGGRVLKDARKARPFVLTPPESDDTVRDGDERI